MSFRHWVAAVGVRSRRAGHVRRDHAMPEVAQTCAYLVCAEKENAVVRDVSPAVEVSPRMADGSCFT